MSHPPLVLDGAVAVAILTAVRTIRCVKTPQALLCLTVLLLSIALIFLILGESFALAFEVSTYSGAGMERSAGKARAQRVQRTAACAKRATQGSHT